MFAGLIFKPKSVFESPLVFSDRTRKRVILKQESIPLNVANQTVSRASGSGWIMMVLLIFPADSLLA